MNEIDPDRSHWRTLTLLARLGPARRRSPARAVFDPARVEVELYDAIYGRRTGTVDNIAPAQAKETPRKTAGSEKRRSPQRARRNTSQAVPARPRPSTRA